MNEQMNEQLRLVRAVDVKVGQFIHEGNWAREVAEIRSYDTHIAVEFADLGVNLYYYDEQEKVLVS